MKISAAYKYQLHSLKKPLFIYYIVIFVLMVLITVSQTVLAENGPRSSFSGFELTTIIFLFVHGLNSFKQPFHMLLANGVSRRTMFITTVAAFVTAATAMALIDGIIALFMTTFFNYETYFMQIFSGYGIGLTALGMGFVWQTFCNISAAMLGFFITTAYYRMSKPIKLLVSIGVPVFFLILLPVINASLFTGRVSRVIRTIVTHLADAFTLLGPNNPVSSVLFSAFVIIITSMFSWLVIRRTTVKE